VKITVLVGNPSPKSRTLGLAEAVADAIAPIVGETSRTVIDLAEVTGSLFDWQNAEVAALNATVAASDIVIVATPTYKASYTGLLKAFLDRYDTNGLSKIVAIPVMTGGSPTHALAPDFTLRPLLVELGASTPTRSLYFMTSQMDQQAEIVQAWVEANLTPLTGAARGRSDTTAEPA
jgi:FMN reductase